MRVHPVIRPGPVRGQILRREQEPAAAALRHDPPELPGAPHPLALRRRGCPLPGRQHDRRLRLPAGGRPPRRRPGAAPATVGHRLSPPPAPAYPHGCHHPAPRPGALRPGRRVLARSASGAPAGRGLLAGGWELGGGRKLQLLPGNHQHTHQKELVCVPATSSTSSSSSTSGVIPEGGQGGAITARLGEGGRNSRRQGCLRRCTGPGTWLSPRSLPPRAPLARLFSPRNHSSTLLQDVAPAALKQNLGARARSDPRGEGGEQARGGAWLMTSRG